MFKPNSPAPLARPPGLFRTLVKLRKNALGLSTRDQFTCPVTHRRLLGHRMTILNDAKPMRHVFVEAREKYGVDPLRKTVLQPICGNGLITADGDDWRDIRGVAKPYFAPAYLAEYAKVFRSLAGDAADAGAREGEVELSGFIGEIAFAATTKCLFSGDGQVDTKAGARAFSAFMENYMFIHLADLLRLPARLLRLAKRRAGGAIAQSGSIIQEIVAARSARRNSGDTPNDLLDGFFDAWAERRNGEEHSTEWVVDNTGTMMAAGYETTGLTMTWALYFLINSPDALERVRGELAEGRHLATEPSTWQKHLPFLHAVILETMRVYPMLPALVRHAKEDDLDGPLEVRKGDYVIANLWAQHRRPDLWSDPEAFRPERFLDASEIADRKPGYYPFGLGPRRCIGANFALLESVVVLATLLDALDFELLDDAPVGPVWRGTIRPDRPIPVRLTRRQAAATLAAP